MKCPKCSYISFDYNQVCPKCNKDISLEQEKLNIPSLKPDPPSLLGALMGGPGETEASLNASGDIPVIHQETQISLGDSQNFPSDDAGLGDSQEVDLALELDAEQNPLAGKESPPDGALQLETGDLAISLDEAAVFQPADEKAGEGDEIPFDLEEIAIESKQLEKEGQAAGGDEKLEIDLADLSLEDGGGPLTLEPARSEGAEGGRGLEIGSLSLEGQEGSAAEENEEITLSLEDLKVNETGELEIGKTIPSVRGRHKVQLMDEMQLELEPASPQTDEETREEDVKFLLGDDTIEIPAETAEDDQQIDLDNLDIELDLDGPDRK